MPKLYFIDTGFLNYTLKNFQKLSVRPDTGMLVESSVFTSLLRNLEDLEELRYWRTKFKEEIDFILRKGKEVIPVEVKWRETVKIPPAIRKFFTQGISKKSFYFNEKYE